jgi:hypothetical protein
MQSALTFDVATCMWYTGIDPFTKKPVTIARGMRDRKMQRALMQFFKPENYFTVREALIEAGRADLIGGCEGLIPANPPKEAIEARRRQANRAVGGEDDDHYHTVANPAKGEKPGERGMNKGYRPWRTSAKRQHSRSVRCLLGRGRRLAGREAPSWVSGACGNQGRQNMDSAGRYRTRGSE